MDKVQKEAIAVLVLVAAWFLCGFVWGMDYTVAYIPPNPDPITRIIIKRVPEYIDRVETQYVKVELEKIIYVPQPHPLPDFPDLETLQQFLSDDQTNTAVFYRLLNDAEGKVLIGDVITGACCSYADLLYQRAAERGYHLDRQLTDSKTHAYNIAWVGNATYGIEPQTDEIWFISYRGDKVQ